MEEFFTGDNWIRNLITLLVPIGILTFAALAFFKRKSNKSKTAYVRGSKKVKIKQGEGSDAKVKGSEDVDIQQ